MGTMTRRYSTLRGTKLNAPAGTPFLTIPDIDVIDEAAFTIEVWLRANAYSGVGDINVCSHGSEPQTSWRAEILNNGRLRGNFFPTGLEASRVGTESSADPGFIAGEVYGLRFGFISSLFGAVSAYTYEINGGGRWRPLGGIVTAALVPVVFDSAFTLGPGLSANIIDIYSFKMWSPCFGANQINQERRVLNANIGNRDPSDTSWPDIVDPSKTWTIQNGALAVSDRPVPFAA